MLCPDRGPLAVAEVPVHPASTADGGVEQDPEELWRSVLAAGGQALGAAGEPVAAVGLANQGETVLAWDPASGTPYGAALSWQDGRAVSVCAGLREHAAELAELTGLPLDPYFAAPKMRWLRDRGESRGVLTTTDSWLVHRLTGVFVTDAATASRTLLLDLDRAAWSPRAAELFGLAGERRPAVVGCAEPVGETTAFGPSLPVTGLAVDQQAALFGESCFAAGEAKCTYGTGAFLLATVGSTPVRSGSGLAGCLAWLLAGQPTYCLDGQVFTVGSAVHWLASIGVVRDAAELAALALTVPDSGGVRFVPALAGLGAPDWRPDARGAFLGLALATSRAQLARAVLEGIAAAVAELAGAVARDLGRPLARLRVDGGLARSRALLQAQADLLQLPVEVFPSPHATAAGVGALARLGAGGAATVAAALPPWRPARVVEPAIGPEEAAARRAEWRAAVDASLPAQP